MYENVQTAASTPNRFGLLQPHFVHLCVGVAHKVQTMLTNLRQSAVEKLLPCYLVAFLGHTDETEAT